MSTVICSCSMAKERKKYTVIEDKTFVKFN